MTQQMRRSELAQVLRNESSEVSLGVEPSDDSATAQGLGGAPSACVVVEDSPHGVAAGLAAGMHVIGFGAGLHMTTATVQRLSDTGAHQIARTAGELGEMLQRGLSGA